VRVTVPRPLTLVRPYGRVGHLAAVGYRDNDGSSGRPWSQSAESWTGVRVGHAYPGTVTAGEAETGFGVYLKEAILAARFPTPTHFARAVGTDPSVVLRWLSGEQRPTIRSIERIAPVLGRSINELVLAAYPDRLSNPPHAAPAAAHPLAHELGRLLADDSPIPRADREALEIVLDRMLEPYRKLSRRRRSG
jgi:transcriptional regulator with XRE-family HTH domain